MLDVVRLLDNAGTLLTGSPAKAPAGGGNGRLSGGLDGRDNDAGAGMPDDAPANRAPDRTADPEPGPSRLARIGEDLRAAYERDPALHGTRVAELVLYPGLWALWTHRAAHQLYGRQVPWLPRLLSQGARLLTGIEIHPGATIGRRCFIDHGMGVVIGETAEVGDDVTIYHGVTLGARGFWRDEKGAKRHPTIGDRVVLGARSSVLGPVTVADGSRVGAHALVVTNVASDTTVTALPAVAHDTGRSTPKLLDYEI
jgi:serine O-acetyltransferase